MSTRGIHTLNGRDNSLLHALWNSAGCDPLQFQVEMERAVDELCRMLSSKGVETTSSRTPLAPSATL